MHGGFAEASNRRVFKDKEIIESKKVLLIVMKRTSKLEIWWVESAKGKLPNEVSPAARLKHSLEHYFESKERKGESNP